MKIEASNIKWDTDGDDMYDLPTTMDITIDPEVEREDVCEMVGDELSNITGWCHFGFEYKVLGNFTVWVGGGEVNDYLLSYDSAMKLADQFVADGYDDVHVLEVQEVNHE